MIKYKTKATEKFEITKKSAYYEDEELDDSFIIEHLGKKPYQKEGSPEEIGKMIGDAFVHTMNKILTLQRRFDYKIELVVKMKKIEEVKKGE